MDLALVIAGAGLAVGTLGVFLTWRRLSAESASERFTRVFEHVRTNYPRLNSLSRESTKSSWIASGLPVLAKVSIHGLAWVDRGGSGGDGWHPGVAGEGVVDGVDGPESVVGGAGEVGADAAEAGQGGQGVPVAGDFLVQFRAFE